MKDIDLGQTNEQIIKHLSFLGYEITVKENRISAVHPMLSNIVVMEYNEEILLVSVYDSSDLAKKDQIGFLAFLNRANQNSRIVRYYTNKDNDIFMKSWYTGDYEQARFGIFLDLWNADYATLETVQGSREYIK